MEITQEFISKFEKRSNNKVKVLSGGDGTLIKEWRNNRKKCLFPIRNYGMCETHSKFYDDIVNDKIDFQFKQLLFPTIKLFGNTFVDNIDTEALSEITFINNDVTQCLRVNIYINNKLANANVLASGILVSTRLGSTGYFKSIARTIFRKGLGLAFICPTYSIPNIVLSETDDIKVEFIRSTNVTITCDKLKYTKDIVDGETFTIGAACNNIPLFGYDIFMCEECRRNRNSTIVNDSYLII